MDFDTKSLILSNLIIHMSSEYKGFQIVSKSDSWLMSAIDIFLKFITLNQFTSFLNSYITTIGHTVYVPHSWDTLSPASKYVILKHEMVHMNQSRKYGPILYSFLYLFCYLPAYRAYWRTKFEKEAYESTIRAAAEMYGKSYVHTLAFQEKVVKYFTGPDYFYMWTDETSIRQWVHDTVRSI